MSLVLIPAVLFASMVPAYVDAAPVKADADTPSSAPAEGPTSPAPGDPAHDGTPSRKDKSDEREEPTTTSPPPVALTPRADSIEALERSLRAPSLSKASARLELSISCRVRTHHKPARLDQLMSRARCVSMAMRYVASRLRSHAPPIQ